MTHADKVREAKERALACLDVWLDAFVEGPEMNAMESAGYEVRALVAQTCATCKGEGTPFCLCQPVSLCNCKPCHAKCDNGRKVASDG